MVVVPRAVEDQLGALLSEYPRRRGASMPYVRIALFTVGALILLGAIIIDPSSLIVYTVTLMWLLVGVLAYYNWSIHRSDTVQLFEQGLVYQERRRRTIIRWDDIDWVVQTTVEPSALMLPLGMVYTFTVRSRTGQLVKLTPKLSRIEELGQEIQDIIHPRLFAEARSKYNQGEVLKFGKVRVHQLGLSVGSKTLPWSELRDVELAGEYMTIRKQGKLLAWKTVRVEKIPNLPVLFRFVREQGLQVRFRS